MDTNSMFSIMDIIVVACGIYIFYAYYLLVVKKEIYHRKQIPKSVGILRTISNI